MQLKRLLDQLYTPELFKDSCPNGLQVEGASEIKKLFTAVSASLDVIEEAIERGGDALVVHHGLFWGGDSYAVQGVKREKLKLLLSSGIHLFAYHLPMDASREAGNNWNAARDLGLTDLAPFAEIGVKGHLLETDREEFLELASAYYRHKATFCLGGNSTVKSVAIVSGGAWKLLPEAIKEGVDLFITGSFDEPAWYLAEEGRINFAAFGHHATERVGPKALAALLVKEHAIDAEFLESHNPF